VVTSKNGDYVEELFVARGNPKPTSEVIDITPSAHSFPRSDPSELGPSEPVPTGPLVLTKESVAAPGGRSRPKLTELGEAQQVDKDSSKGRRLPIEGLWEPGEDCFLIQLPDDGGYPLVSSPKPDELAVDADIYEFDGQSRKVFRWALERCGFSFVQPDKWGREIISREHLIEETGRKSRRELSLLLNKWFEDYRVQRNGMVEYLDKSWTSCSDFQVSSIREARTRKLKCKSIYEILSRDLKYFGESPFGKEQASQALRGWGYLISKL